MSAHSLHSGNRVSHPSPGTFPHPAAPDHLPGPGLQPAGSPQPHPAGGALPQPLCHANVRQLQQGQQAGRPAGQRAEQQQSPSGQDEGVPRQRHGLSGQQHATQLAGGSLLPPDSPRADPRTGLTRRPATTRRVHGSRDGVATLSAAFVIHYSFMF